MILPIIQHPSPILREISIPVQLRDIKVAKNLIVDMIDTLKAAKGQGLAAPQVGVNKRIIVVDVVNKILPMINPTFILISSKQRNLVEGCLSIPDSQVTKARYNEIQVSYYNTGWDKCVIKLYNEAAVCVQHEIDHLNGVLMID